MYRNLSYFFDICIAVLPALIVPLGLAALIALAVTLGGCTKHQEPAGATSIDGVLTYRERMALPVNAEYEVLLYEVTPGSERVLLAQVQMPTYGASVPIPFQIAQLDKPLSSGASYELEAHIRVDSEILFTTQAGVPVVEGAEATLLLHREIERPVSLVPSSSAVLSGKKWLLREMGGRKVETWPDQEVPHVLFTPDTDLPDHSTSIQGRLSGSDGCNRIIGTYTQSGSNLRFQHLGTTMMLCPQGADQSAAFSHALSETSSWKISRNGQSLELLQNSRRLLLFVPAPSVKSARGD